MVLDPFCNVITFKFGYSYNNRFYNNFGLNVVFSNYQEINFLFEMVERVEAIIRYQGYLQSPPKITNIFNVLMSFEASNILISLGKDNQNINKILKEGQFNNYTEFLNFIKNASSGGIGNLWLKYISLAPTPEYLKNEFAGNADNGLKIARQLSFWSENPKDYKNNKIATWTDRANIFQMLIDTMDYVDSKYPGKDINNPKMSNIVYTLLGYKLWSVTKKDLEQGVAEGNRKPEPPEADYGADYQDMVSRVKKLAGLGPLKTVYDPAKRVYRNMPTAVQPKKEQR
jgi:hypothetical protein